MSSPSNSPTPASSDDLPTWVDPKASARSRRANAARNASGRRRLIDPTTCERDYSDAEGEFLKAIQEYKRSSGRMFPTWSEVLEVVRGLGYRQSPQPGTETSTD